MRSPIAPSHLTSSDLWVSLRFSVVENPGQSCLEGVYRNGDDLSHMLLLNTDRKSSCTIKIDVEWPREGKFKVTQIFSGRRSVHSRQYISLGVTKENLWAAGIFSCSCGLSCLSFAVALGESSGDCKLPMLISLLSLCFHLHVADLVGFHSFFNYSHVSPRSESLAYWKDEVTQKIYQM